MAGNNEVEETGENRSADYPTTGSQATTVKAKCKMSIRNGARVLSKSFELFHGEAELKIEDWKFDWEVILLHESDVFQANHYDF